jgi:hypothetical protein
MSLDLLHRRTWDTLSAEECEVVARDMVADRLPAGFTFLAVKRCEMGDQRRWVAQFEWRGAAFSLIPGGDATLGYDQTLLPYAAGVEGELWRLLGAEEGTLPLTPVRQAHIRPFLLEVSAKHQPDVPDHASALANAAAEGFRLATSDEWEYACAAGSRSLWRWGNDWGLLHFPEYAGQSYYGMDPYGNDPDWDRHRQPNAFGLHYEPNIFNYDRGNSLELCQEPDVRRGFYRPGFLNYDGLDDAMIGADYAGLWLTFASAFVMPSFVKTPLPPGLRLPAEPVNMRRLWPLS